jgi:hypothetical protein
VKPNGCRVQRPGFRADERSTFNAQRTTHKCGLPFITRWAFVGFCCLAWVALSGRVVAATDALATNTAPTVQVSDEIVIAADGPGQRLRGCQAVARGKDQYLAVWREGWIGQGGASRVFAARLASDGKLLDPKGIELTPSASQRQDRPRVAFCPSTGSGPDGGDKYLVVWQEFNGRDMDVYGVRVGLDGKVLDARPLAIAVAPETQVMPEVASDGQTGFLVVWQGFLPDETSARSFAALVGADGAIGQPVPHPCAPRPNVVWSSTNYLVWGGPVGTFSDMWLQRVAADGKLVGKGWKRLGTADNIGAGYCVVGATHTSLAHRPGEGWLLVCDRAVPDFWGWAGPGALRAYAITADGKLDATQPRETHPKGGELQPNWIDVVKGEKEKKTWPYARHAVAWDGRQWIAVWTAFHFGGTTGIDLVNGDLMLARVDGWKSREGMTPIKVAAAEVNELNPALATDGTGTLMCVYEKQPDDAKNNMVIAARVIRTGQ